MMPMHNPNTVALPLQGQWGAEGRNTYHAMFLVAHRDEIRPLMGANIKHLPLSMDVNHTIV